MQTALCLLHCDNANKVPSLCIGAGDQLGSPHTIACAGRKVGLDALISCCLQTCSPELNYWCMCGKCLSQCHHLATSKKPQNWSGSAPLHQTALAALLTQATVSKENLQCVVNAALILIANLGDTGELPRGVPFSNVPFEWNQPVWSASIGRAYVDRSALGWHSMRPGDRGLRHSPRSSPDSVSSKREQLMSQQYQQAFLHQRCLGQDNICLQHPQRPHTWLLLDCSLVLSSLSLLLHSGQGDHQDHRRSLLHCSICLFSRRWICRQRRCRCRCRCQCRRRRRC